MKAITKVLAGGVVATALFSAAPAAAQYYPNPYGYGYGSGGNVIGQVLNQVLGGGYGYGQGYGYGVNSQAVTSQCINAVNARLARSYGNVGYGYGYGYTPYSTARVLGISRVEQRSNGGLQVRGVATTGMSGAYGYGGQPAPDISFRCRTDYRGYVVDVDLDRTNSAYGYQQQQYTPYGTDYSQYGYRRY